MAWRHAAHASQGAGTVIQHHHMPSARTGLRPRHAVFLHCTRTRDLSSRAAVGRRESGRAAQRGNLVPFHVGHEDEAGCGIRILEQYPLCLFLLV